MTSVRYCKWYALAKHASFADLVEVYPILSDCIRRQDNKSTFDLKERRQKRKEGKDEGREIVGRFRSLRQPSFTTTASRWIKENAVKPTGEIRPQFQGTFQDGTDGSFCSILSIRPLGANRTAEKATNVACYFAHEAIERLTYLKSIHEKVESAHTVYS